jgi:solute carrier family 25 oxoglutarate transporter 11
MPEKNKGGLAKALEPFVCGGSAATFASIFIHPIDLAKVRQTMAWVDKMMSPVISVF